MKAIQLINWAMSLISFTGLVFYLASREGWFEAGGYWVYALPVLFVLGLVRFLLIREKGVRWFLIGLGGFFMILFGLFKTMHWPYQWWFLGGAISSYLVWLILEILGYLKTGKTIVENGTDASQHWLFGLVALLFFTGLLFKFFHFPGSTPLLVLGFAGGVYWLIRGKKSEDRKEG